MQHDRQRRGRLEYMYICCIYVYFCCVRSLGHQTLRDSLEYMYICCICISVVFGAWISSLAGCICILVIYIYIVWHMSHLRILFNGKCSSYIFSTHFLHKMTRVPHPLPKTLYPTVFWAVDGRTRVLLCKKCVEKV